MVNKDFQKQNLYNEGLLQSAASSHGLFNFARIFLVRVAIRELGVLMPL